jgi:hypothetical protein
MGIVSGRKEVATVGTRVQLVTTSQWVKVVDITAETNNTGTVTVGDSAVVGAVNTRTGTPLVAGQTKTYYNVDLSSIWLDTTVNTDGVTYDASF